MDIRSLRYFVEVVRQGGFTRAAGALHVTQPTISKMVKALEDELGGPLLLREGRTVQLTDAGKVVLARGQAVLAEVARLRQEVAEVDGMARGELAVGIPPMAGRYFAPVIGAYRRQYPGVALRLREQGGRALEEGVASGELDLGVTVLPATVPGLGTLPVTRHALTVIYPAARAPASMRALPLAALAGESFVMYEDDFVLYRVILDACEAAGFLPQIAGQSRHWDFIGELVAADVGIALLPEPIARSLDPARVAVRPLAAPELTWELGLVWREGYLSRAARAWLDACQRAFGTPSAP
ncbi:LysR family transcriptional regulator [Cupriavidus sp. USMAA2-4]|uniref:LysR family transcriptional regulator n=1 Tax=unclassified Cupriavidus TaxID=2640874 RepID=UPI0008A6DB06|nr:MULTISPECIES: LysR family transcriptional regulator [unclassified Cupriavidus]AOY96729.1 LysR family transcriptional regulator [Cupriavidus sp. USMAA2-4]AOZ02868.1 LysR family transcriptional regulator [Cupriavidus sp. USMAHM13]